MFRRFQDQIDTHVSAGLSIRLLRRIGIVTLLIYIAFFLVRRNPPHLDHWFLCDFANFYSGSRVWISGGDPYQVHEVYRAWDQSGHGTWLSIPRLEQDGVWAAVYPPPTLAALAPIAMLRAFPAQVLWVALNMAVCVAICLALWSMGRIRDWEQRLLVGLLVLASSTYISTFESGQLALLAGGLVISGIWALRNSGWVLAGLLIGLAACFKIQVGVPVILYFALARRWRPALLAGTVFALICLVGIIPLEIHRINWLSEFSYNAAQTLGPSGVNDPMPGAPFRNDMVNLQTLLYVIMDNSRIVDAISFGLVIAGAAWLVMLVAVTPRADRSLPLLSLAIVLSVLPIYHRLYDTLVLALLLIWALRRLGTPMRGYAITTLIILSEFLIPIDFVPTIVRWLHLPARLTQTMWWQGLVVPHHAWGMLLLAGWLLYMCTALVPRRHGADEHAAIGSPTPARPGHWPQWAKLS